MLRFGTGDREPHFLVVRRRRIFRPHYYDIVLDWVGQNYPGLLSRFRVKSLPCSLPSRTSVVLHIPWLQDPVQRWSPKRYRQANRLAAECDARGIPIINRVDRLINASKCLGSRLMAEAGIGTPRMALIEDADAFRETLLGVGLPLFVREDWGHTGPMIRADTLDEARRIPLDGFQRPVAVQIIDVQDRSDGLYRKYRYVAAGEFGVALHLQITREWITRGGIRIVDERVRKEELAYIGQQDANHAALQTARRALGLDFVAFDYGYDRDGQMIVWEANPYPYLHFSPGDRAYRNHAVHRTLAAMLAMYLSRAQLPIPDQLMRRVAY